MSLNDSNVRVHDRIDQTSKTHEQINYMAGMTGDSWSATWNNSLVILENFAETYSRQKAKASQVKNTVE